MPAVPAGVLEPLWVQFSALLPERDRVHPDHPLHGRRPRVDDRIVFDKLVQVPVFGCSYAKIADSTCSCGDSNPLWITGGAAGGPRWPSTDCCWALAFRRGDLHADPMANPVGALAAAASLGAAAASLGHAAASLGHAAASLGAALVDLALPETCAGCGAPGPMLCGECAATLHAAPRPCPPDPSPATLPMPWAVAAYAGPVRTALSAHKEDGRLALVGPLGDALGRAVTAAALSLPSLPVTARPLSPERRVRSDWEDRPPPVLVIPVPSNPAAVRARGQDHALRLARRASDYARCAGIPARCAPALRLVRRTADQAGLTADARATNLHGALALAPRWRVFVAGRTVIVVDDVITTGATLAEAARALRAGNAIVPCVAAIAATQREVRMTPSRRLPEPHPSAGSGWG